MRRYPEEIKEFILENVKGRTTKELTDLVNKKFDTGYTYGQIKSYKGNHGLKGEVPRGSQKGKVWIVYPPEVKKFIQENHKGTSWKKMAEMIKEKFGQEYTQRQIKGYYANNNLNSGLTGHFPKGNVPYNKGKKGIRNSIATEFKKGNVPANYMPVGSERINTYGYTDIKIKDPGTWKPKHIILWEEENGPIPEGHVVIFADRDKTNFSLDNLILVSRRQLLIINRRGLIQEDTELTRTGIVIADLIIKTTDRQKQRREAANDKR